MKKKMKKKKKKVGESTSRSGGRAARYQTRSGRRFSQSRNRIADRQFHWNTQTLTNMSISTKRNNKQPKVLDLSQSPLVSNKK
jgi:hypothetical protein